MKNQGSTSGLSDNPEKENAIVLFDGVCNLCSASVQWIIQHDPDAHFRFCSLQSEKGKELQRTFGIPESENSVILIEKNQYYTRSGAALRIAKKCSGLWKWLYAFIIIPAPLRDLIYSFIARNRYRWFGKKELCWMPDPQLSKRFLND